VVPSGGRRSAIGYGADVPTLWALIRTGARETLGHTRIAERSPTTKSVRGDRPGRVLAVLDGDAVVSRRVLERAVEIAETTRARLTLSKPTRPGLFTRVCAHLGAAAELCSFLFESSDCNAPDAELQAAVATELALIAEHLSCSVPLTTLVLRGSASAALRRVAKAGTYDAVILPARVAGRRGRLRSAFRGPRVEIVSADGLVITDPTPVSDAD
jgi:hypothetical protein